MAKRSAAWTWFGWGCGLSLVVAAGFTGHTVADLLNEAGDPALGTPVLAVVITAIMSFFGTLLPGMAFCGALVLMVDAIARTERSLQDDTQGQGAPAKKED